MGFLDDLGDAVDAVGDGFGTAMGAVFDIARTSKFWAGGDDPAEDMLPVDATQAQIVSKRAEIARYRSTSAATSLARRRREYFRDHATVAKAAGVTADVVGGGLHYLDLALDKTQQAGSTYSIMLSGDLPGTGGGIFGTAGAAFTDTGRASWGKAWDLAEGASPGQATFRAMTTEDSSGRATGAVADALGIRGSTWENIRDYGERGDDKFSSRFSLASGSFDVAFAWVADPLVIGGKAAKVAHAAQTQVRAGDVAALAAGDAASLTGRAKRIRNQFDRFIADTDGKSAVELMQYKAFADSTQGAALASLFANANRMGDDADEVKRLVWRTAMGDRTAKVELVNRRADLSFQVDRLQEDLDFLLTPGVSSIRDPKEIEAELKSSERVLDLFDRALGDEKAQALAAQFRVPLNKDDAGILGSVDRRAFVSRRDLRRAEKSASYTVQDGIGGIPVRVMRAPTQRRPDGWIDYHDAEQGLVEFDRMTQRVRGLDPEKRLALLDGYANAKDDAARMLAHQAIENTVFQHIGSQLGYTPDEIRSLLTKVRTEREAALGRYKTRAYSAAEDETGVPVDFIEMEDGSLLRRPLMETQLANSAPVLDVDHVYRVLKRNRETVKALRLGRETFDVAEDAADFLNDLWKTSVLLRGGYLIRNVMDSQLRLLAFLGGMDTMRIQAENVGQTLRRRLSVPQARAVHERNVAELEAARASLKAAKTPEEQAALREMIAGLETAVEAGPAVLPRFGQGVVDAGPYKVGDARGVLDTEADLIDKSVSSRDMYASLAMGEADRILNTARGSGNWVTVHGDDPNWAQDYLRVVNQQVRQSEIAQRLISGESPQDVARWLRSPEGRALRRRLVHGHDTPEELVEANLQNLNHLVPNPEARALLAERGLTADDLDRLYPSTASRPAVNAEQVAFSLGQGKVAETYKAVRDKWFAFANGIPDDVMGRHPMYVALYRGKVRDLLHRSDPSLEGTISAAEQAVLETQARSFARREMKRLMFDAANKSNLGHFVRFIMPFYSAWEDVIIKYGRMIANDPSLVPQAWKIWSAPNSASFVEIVDAQTGKPVPASESRLHDDEVVRLPAPWLKRYFSQGGMDIPKASFNVVLQGDPWFVPGFGPMAQAPANSIANTIDNPSVSDMLQELGVLPYGTEDAGRLSWKKFLPTVVKNAAIDDSRKVRMKAMILQTEIYRFRNGERDKMPTADEINARLRNLMILRGFTSLASPAAVQYKSPYQFYIDESHAYDEKYGPDADRKFYQQYGEDLYLFRASMSENRTGVRSSDRADAKAREVKDLIAKHPDYGWFFVGPDNVGEYNRNVYTAQTLRKVNPLSNDVWRDTYADPYEAIERNNAEIGWLEYQKLTARLEAIRIQRGLPNMQVKAAADLAAAKRAWLASLTGDDAPAWAHDWLNDYQNRDSGAVRKFLEAARDATKDPRLAKRSDMRTMAEYLKYRDAIRGIIAERAKAGGSHTLAGNDDIEAAWAAITGYLVERDVTFADVYGRYLERDDLSEAA